MNEAMMRDSLRRDGYIALRGFVDPDGVREIEANLKRFIADVVPRMPAGEVYYEDKSRPETLKQLQLMYQYDEFFRTLMFGGAFEHVARVLLGGDVVGQNLQYFNKPGGLGQATPAHQDGYYFMLEPPEALTMWFALDRTDAGNGCVRYVRGSHARGMRPHGRTSTLGFSQGITDYGTADDLANEVAIDAEPGDLLIHHALTIHRADANRDPNRSRRALGLVFYSANAKRDETAYAAYQRRLDEELAQAGKI
jgi:phytanoyl-CoA hydroxylase